MVFLAARSRRRQPRATGFAAGFSPTRHILVHWGVSTPLLPSPRQVLGGVALALLLTNPAGCKGKKATNKPDKASQQADEEAKARAKAEEDALLAQVARNPSMKPMLVDDARCNKAGKKVHQVDVNSDGRADLITLTARGKLGEKLVCKQADLNFDGRLDAFLHYDDQEGLDREQFDLDFDGKIDLGRYYKEGLLFLDEQDLDHDGYVDAWRRYDKGRLVRIDDDRDHDGRPDMFTFFAAGQIDRVGYDIDGDGKVDRWDQEVADRAKEALAIRQREIEKLRAEDGDEYVDEENSGPEPPTEPDTDTSASEDKTPQGDKQDKGKGAKGNKDAKKDNKGKSGKAGGKKAGDTSKAAAKDEGKKDAATTPKKPQTPQTPKESG